MRKSNTEHIQAVVDDYLKSLGIYYKVREYRVIREWEKMMGQTISKSIVKSYIKDRKLFIYTKSSVVRNELFMIREGIKDKINELAGIQLVDEVILK